MIELTFSKGIDVNMTDASKQCIISHHCFFSDKDSGYINNVYESFRYFNITCVDYFCIVKKISKGKHVDLLQNSGLNKKLDRYKRSFFFIVYKYWIKKL